MDDAYASLLQTLRDIEGVIGSFLLNEHGELLGRDIPAACGSDVLLLAGGKLQQLCDAFVSAHIGGSFESATLSFAEHKLHVRALGGAFLVAVLAADANMHALKMAMNMVGRRIVSDAVRPSTVPAPLAPPAPGRVSGVPPEADEGVARSYRGRRIGG